jgi:hypothetical protein
LRINTAETQPSVALIPGYRPGFAPEWRWDICSRGRDNGFGGTTEWALTPIGPPLPRSEAAKALQTKQDDKKAAAAAAAPQPPQQARPQAQPPPVTAADKAFFSAYPAAKAFLRDRKVIDFLGRRLPGCPFKVARDPLPADLCALGDEVMGKLADLGFVEPES